MATTKVIAVTCVDTRVLGTVIRFLKKIGFPEGSWALQTIPGASLNIDDVLSGIDLVVNQLGAKQILVFDHQQCRAYELANQDLDCDHDKCLWDARKLLEEKYPNVTIRTFLIVSQKGGRWSIKETQD